MLFLPAAAISVVGVVTALILAAWGTRPLSAWYQALKKPLWQPEPGTIGLAWTIIYPLITVASVMVLMRADTAMQRWWIVGFVINMVLNALWSWLFFVMKNPYLGSLGLALLVASVASLLLMAAMVWWVPVLLLLPYLGWTSLAFAVNFTIAKLN
jgi:tryptophan-rich sensory protein